MSWSLLAKGREGLTIRIVDKESCALVDDLGDPTVVFARSWADVLLHRLKGETKLQRLAQLVKGGEGITAEFGAPARVVASDYVEIR